MKCIFIISLLLLQPYIFAESRDFDLSSGEIEMESISGDINVTSNTSSKVIVNYKKKKWSDHCTLSFNQVGAELEIKVDKKMTFFQKVDCKVDFDISMPKRVELEIENSVGAINFNNIYSKTSVELGSGVVSVVNSNIPSLDLEIGSGTVKLDGEFTELEADFGSGSLNATLTNVVKGSKFKFNFGSGSASLNVPHSITTNVKFESGVGTLTNNTKTSKNSDMNIEFRAGSGSLIINSKK